MSCYLTNHSALLKCSACIPQYPLPIKTGGRSDRHFHNRNRCIRSRCSITISARIPAFPQVYILSLLIQGPSYSSDKQAYSASTIPPRQPSSDVSDSYTHGIKSNRYELCFSIPRQSGIDGLVQEPFRSCWPYDIEPGLGWPIEQLKTLPFVLMKWFMPLFNISDFNIQLSFYWLKTKTHHSTLTDTVA